MKKILAIIFTVFYFGFSSGMVYNVHYCLDKIFISAADSPNNSCDVCGSKKQNDCCKNEIKVLKTDVSQKSDATVIIDMPLAIAVEKFSYSTFLAPFWEANAQYFSNANAPPDNLRVPLFISHCNFRI